MKILRSVPVLAAFALLPFAGGCAATAANIEVTKPSGSVADDKIEADKKSEEQKQRAKDLQQKQRDLDYAKIAVQTAGLDRQVRMMGAEASVQKSQRELDKEKRELELFLGKHRPRELEEHQISLDHQIHRAEEAKEELAELEAMYKEDEFARSTKELVIRRGRRNAEMADRSLAVARQEMELFEKTTLAERERALRDKVKDAELELEKSRLEMEKAKLEVDVQQRQADDKVKDLQRDIEELQQKIATEAK